MRPIWQWAALVVLVFGLFIGPVVATPARAEVAPPGHPATEAGLPYRPGELVVRFTPAAARTLQVGPDGRLRVGQLPSLEALNRRYQVTQTTALFGPVGEVGAAEAAELAPVYVLAAPPDTDVWAMAADYAADGSVEYAEPNFAAWLVNGPESSAASVPGEFRSVGLNLPNDFLFGLQYSLHNTGQSGGLPGADVGAPAAWSIQTGDPAVLIAILDTGVDYTHPDLAGKVRTHLGYDFVDRDGDVMDTFDHGTAVASVAAASTDNWFGMAGLCRDCRILPVRVGRSQVDIANREVAQGIVYAAWRGAGVINLSLGGQCSRLWADAVNYAYERGVTLVAAAGTYPESVGAIPLVVYPARFDRVVGVTATDRFDRFAGAFSGFGPTVDLSAPGADILRAKLGGGYLLGNGTSYSTPLTAATAGLLRAENPALSNAQIRQILRDTAVDLGEPGFDPYYGYGRLDAYQALLQAANPPAMVYDPGPDTCGCLLEQTVPDSRQWEADFRALRRLRDEVFADTFLGRRITGLYDRHTQQVVSILLRNPGLRQEMVALLRDGVPAVRSLVEGDGRLRLDGDLVARTGAFVGSLADRANPQLAADLLETWQALDLDAYSGRPVNEATKALQGTHELYLPLVGR